MNTSSLYANTRIFSPGSGDRNSTLSDLNSWFLLVLLIQAMGNSKLPKEQNCMLVVNTLERIAIQERANQSHKQKQNPKQSTKYKTPQSKQTLPQTHILS